MSILYTLYACSSPVVALPTGLGSNALDANVSRYNGVTTNRTLALVRNADNIVTFISHPFGLASWTSGNFVAYMQVPTADTDVTIQVRVRRMRHDGSSWATVDTGAWGSTHIFYAGFYPMVAPALTGSGGTDLENDVLALDYNFRTSKNNKTITYTINSQYSRVEMPFIMPYEDLIVQQEPPSGCNGTMPVGEYVMLAYPGTSASLSGTAAAGCLIAFTDVGTSRYFYPTGSYGQPIVLTPVAGMTRVVTGVFIPDEWRVRIFRRIVGTDPWFCVLDEAVFSHSNSFFVPEEPDTEYEYYASEYYPPTKWYAESDYIHIGTPGIWVAATVHSAFMSDIVNGAIGVWVKLGGQWIAETNTFTKVEV